MNPNILNFSKGWSFIRLALMVGCGAVLLWLLSESSVFAEPPPRPVPPADFRFDAAMFEYSEMLRAARPRQEYGLDRLTGGWFSVIVLLASLPLALWEIAIQIWRLSVPEPALALRNGELAVHGSFITAPSAIPTHAITNVTLDRADRVRLDTAGFFIKAYSWPAFFGGRLGGRLRYVLLIDYASESGEQQSFRMNDTDVDGGIKQLRRFADYLRMILSSRERRPL
jgi:hypothetical protein